VLPPLALVVAVPTVLGLVYNDLTFVPWFVGVLCAAQAADELAGAAAIAFWERRHPARVLQVGRWWDSDDFVLAP
jgi:hypothetical protein